jgi:DNA-directed RNA polymerase subunit M/transcription elongation factor TFIIS
MRGVVEPARTEEPAMADDRYVIMTVECPRCKTKQKVHVAARTGFAQMGDQTIQCLRCDDHFKATVPDSIIRGPFPA